MIARRCLTKALFLAASALCLIGQAPPALAQAAAEQAILAHVEQIGAGKPLRVQGAPIAAVDFIPDFYRLRRFEPAWTDQDNVEALLAAIKSSPEQGLNPADFHAEALDEMRARLASGSDDPAALADFDVLMTDSLVRLGSQIVDGKLDPAALDSSWNFGERVLDTEPVVLANEAIESRGVGQLLRDLEPKHPFYGELKAGLAKYREFEAKGGWPELPDGPSLKPGMEDGRVALLRDRLVITGDLNVAAGAPTVFDGPLEEAVKQFQRRHGLEPDGAVGPATRAAMNLPPQAKIDKIRVNLERARWVLPGLKGDFIIVNVAGFRTFVMNDDDIKWTTRSIVGAPFRKTPVFRENMTHIVFNPTWTVPSGILRRNILPKAKKDPNFLTANNFKVIARDGKAVDPASLDWEKLSAKGFPYRIVQGPGDKNALGRVKFMFPNKYAVYLHDTPSKPLFEKAERAFSSGCIRIDKPFDLAELLLRDDPNWTRERIDQVLASGKTTTVNLSKPLPVLLQYWTVETVRWEGKVAFRKDIYDRDAAILKGLNAAYVFR